MIASVSLYSLKSRSVLAQKTLSALTVSIENMSESITERGWFSYRYAVPGFIFIIFVFLFNLDTIIYILIKNPIKLDLAAIVAVLAFLSGPAVGFVVTQIWYLIFGKKIGRRSVRICFYRKNVREMLEKRGVRRDRFVVDADYWALEEVSPQVFNYLTRRWDLFHVLVSTALTTFVSCMVGYFGVRGLHLKELFTGSCSSQLDKALIDNLNRNMTGVLLCIFLAAIFLGILLVVSAWIIRDENQDMILRFLEVRCGYCGHLMFTTSSVCPNCGARRTYFGV